MNSQKILNILHACSIVMALIEAKMQIREIANVKLVKFDKVSQLLKESESEIEYQILYVKSKIKSMISHIDGYDHRIHKQLDYISSSEIEDGFVDISLADNGSAYLNLVTGEIVPSEEVPEDKRSR